MITIDEKCREFGDKALAGELFVRIWETCPGGLAIYVGKENYDVYLPQGNLRKEFKKIMRKRIKTITEHLEKCLDNLERIEDEG